MCSYSQAREVIQKQTNQKFTIILSYTASHPACDSPHALQSPPENYTKPVFRTSGKTTGGQCLRRGAPRSQHPVPPTPRLAGHALARLRAPRPFLARPHSVRRATPLLVRPLFPAPPPIDHAQAPPQPARAVFGHWGDRRRQRLPGSGTRRKGTRSGRVRGGQLWARCGCGCCGRSGALGTMALCARAALLLLLGALQVLALPGAAADPQGSPSGNHSVPLLPSRVNVTENTTVHMASNQTSKVNNSTLKPLVTSELPRNVTAVTVKPIAKISTPGVSPNMTSTASKSTPKASASPKSTQTAASMMTTGHNSLKTSITITATVHSDKSKGSKFDTGSFVGGIVLTLGVLSVLYIGCKVYYSRRGIRYRSIDEHDAII
ncbi:porimin [Microtus pennsylvanicus]|uniref:porimin n=1 Tax=Microtus pennsylvanicus TaxID=10058 RepID=UPI003F6B3223